MNIETLILAMMGVGALIVIGSLVMIVLRQSVGEEVNFKIFFVFSMPLTGMGLTWIVMDCLLPVGIALFSMGTIYLTLSLAYKDKWSPIRITEREE